MTSVLEWLSAGSSLNLVIAFLTVAIYALFQFFASQNQARDRARTAPSEVPSSTLRNSRQPCETGRFDQARAVKGQQRAALGDDKLSKDSFRVFVQYPTLSLDCRALLVEQGDSALEDGVSLSSDALKSLREAANVCKVFLILCDNSTDGLLEAIVRSALETAHVVGSGNGQVPRHRFLVCTTVPGKVAIVRQLETSLHIECDQGVHEELSRFGVTQWNIMPPGCQNSFVDKVNAVAASYAT
jgi:hypothetical protein